MTPQWFAIPFFYFFLFFLLDPSPNVFATDDAMAVEQRDSEPRERDIILSSISISKPASLLSSWKYEICHRSTKLLVLGFWIPLLLTTSLQARLSMKSVLWKPTPWNGIPFFIDACNHLFLLCFFSPFARVMGINDASKRWDALTLLKWDKITWLFWYLLYFSITMVKTPWIATKISSLRVPQGHIWKKLKIFGTYSLQQCQIFAIAPLCVSTLYAEWNLKNFPSLFGGFAQAISSKSWYVFQCH